MIESPNQRQRKELVEWTELSRGKSGNFSSLLFRNPEGKSKRLLPQELIANPRVYPSFFNDASVKVDICFVTHTHTYIYIYNSINPNLGLNSMSLEKY